jgi:2,4-diketo-3-deoxy-L-fuconate hydrolase
MFFSVAELIAHISRFFTLLPGDIITTGTPAGVGMGRNPPSYLKEGDVMELSATGLGTQRQHVGRFPE